MTPEQRARWDESRWPVCPSCGSNVARLALHPNNFYVAGCWWACLNSFCRDHFRQDSPEAPAVSELQRQLPGLLRGVAVSGHIGRLLEACALRELQSKAERRCNPVARPHSAKSTKRRR